MHNLHSGNWNILYYPTHITLSKDSCNWLMIDGMMLPAAQTAGKLHDSRSQTCNVGDQIMNNVNAI